MIRQLKITYVNNAWDNTAKLLSVEKFNEIINDPKTKETLELYRATGDEKYKKKLPAFIINGVVTEGDLLQGIIRKDENYTPSPLIGLDIDKKGNPMMLFEQAKKLVLEKLGNSFERHFLMVYITPSRGLRIIARRTPGLTIEECRKEWEQIIEIPCDPSCTNLSRLFFMPIKEEILYENAVELFNLGDYNPKIYPSEKVEDSCKSSYKAAESCNFTVSNDYCEADLRSIATELEFLLGGGPAAEGGRNNFVFDMARFMSYLTNNEEVLTQIIPSYGLTAAEHARTVSQGMKYMKYNFTPIILKRAIEVALHIEDEAVETANTPPELPQKLPPVMETILSATPENMKPAVAMACFSALRILLEGVKFKYIDNKDSEPCFMSLTIAPQASGKTALREPINAILHEIAEQDRINREEDLKWHEEYCAKGSSQNKPARPNAPILMVQADMTNAALTNLCRRASGKSLFTYAEELEKLLKLQNLSDICRTAFDTEIYGQERYTGEAVSMQVTMRWSWAGATTPGTAKEILKKETQNGTLTRISLSTIEINDDIWGEEIPVYGDYDDDYKQSIAQYTHFLKEIPSGVYTFTEPQEWARKEFKKQIDAIRSMDAKYLRPYAYRSILIGFWRACMLYIMNNYEWTDEIATFASWSVSYDLWVKNHYFGQIIETKAELDAVKPRPKSFLHLLPDTFTREDVKQMRQKIGKSIASKAIKDMIATWTYRGEIIKIPNTESWRKVKK